MQLGQEVRLPPESEHLSKLSRLGYELQLSASGCVGTPERCVTTAGCGRSRPRVVPTSVDKEADSRRGFFGVIPEKQMPGAFHDLEAGARDSSREQLCIRDRNEWILIAADDERLVTDALEKRQARPTAGPHELQNVAVRGGRIAVPRRRVPRSRSSIASGYAAVQDCGHRVEMVARIESKRRPK